MTGEGVLVKMTREVGLVEMTKRLFGNFRGKYPDLGVRACLRTLAPPNLS
jgi:hypothetical protein